MGEEGGRSEEVKAITVTRGCERLLWLVALLVAVAAGIFWSPPGRYQFHAVGNSGVTQVFDTRTGNIVTYVRANSSVYRSDLLVNGGEYQKLEKTK
jgi:hypothetical protein